MNQRTPRVYGNRSVAEEYPPPERITRVFGCRRVSADLVEPPTADGIPEEALPSRGWLALAVLALTSVLYVTVGAFAQEYLNLVFGLWFTEVFVFLGVSWVLTQMSGRDPATYLGLKGGRTSAVALGFGLGVTNYFAFVIPLQWLALRLAPERLKQWMPDPDTLFSHRSPVELALLVGALAIAAPCCEELMFRGVLQRGLVPRAPRFVAVIMTAALFSLFHLDPIGFWARFEMGLLFGWLFEVSGSLWPNAAAHAANNLTTTALFCLSRGSPLDEEPTLREAFGIGAMGLVVFLGLLVVIRWRPHWLRGEPPPFVAAPRRSLERIALPWLVAGTLSLGTALIIERYAPTHRLHRPPATRLRGR
jgi:membrane protease YdiL (CAAX protease family)